MKVVSINVSAQKGVAKTPVEKIELIENHGIVGDAHAAPGERQVSLLAKESVEAFKKSGVKACLNDGSFGENMTTEGIELHTLNIGTRLVIDSVILEISKIGKECHTHCAIRRSVGDCIMPKQGVFAKVIKGGTIRRGDKITLEKYRPTGI